MCLASLGFAQAGAQADESGTVRDGEDAAATEPVDESALTFGDGDEADAAADDGPGSINSFGVWDFVRMIAVLGVVIAVIYLVFFLLKRASGGRFENSPLVRLLGSHALPGNKALHLVEVGRQVFLIGVGDDGITLVSEITDQESLDEVRLAASTTQSQRRGSFSDMLSGFFGAGPTAGGGGPTSGSTGSAGSASDGHEDRRATARGGNGGAPPSFFESQKERLRKLR